MLDTIRMCVYICVSNILCRACLTKSIGVHICKEFQDKEKKFGALTQKFCP